MKPVQRILKYHLLLDVCVQFMLWFSLKSERKYYDSANVIKCFDFNRSLTFLSPFLIRLVQNLRKHCDVPEVAQAHEIMKNVAKHIDQVKRNLEQQSRVKELSGILDGWLGPELTVLGDLKLEGMLMENNKPRIVLLFQNMMIITKKKEDNRLQLKTYIQVSERIS